MLFCLASGERDYLPDESELLLCQDRTTLWLAAPSHLTPTLAERDKSRALAERQKAVRTPSQHSNKSMGSRVERGCPKTPAPINNRSTDFTRHIFLNNHKMASKFHEILLFASKKMSNNVVT